MDEQLLANNIANLLERVRLAAQKSQRSAGDINVLAVSKTRTDAEIRMAYALGCREFGENYLQEALSKITALQDLDIKWHFIGPIQSNKARAISEHFDWVHSVERGKIARRLNEYRSEERGKLQVCVQVNISGEQSKSGVSPGELRPLVEEILGMPRLRLRGLMAIPTASDDFAAQRGAFARLRQCLDDVRDLAPELDTLSMGMSGDLEAAIREGSTLVRIGTDIFGPRG